MNIRYYILLSFRNKYVYIKLDKINIKNFKKWKLFLLFNIFKDKFI